MSSRRGSCDDADLRLQVRQSATHPKRSVRRAWYGRTWQAEWEWCPWCPRAYTERGVRRKAARWLRRGPEWHDRHARRRQLLRAYITDRRDSFSVMVRANRGREVTTIDNDPGVSPAHPSKVGAWQDLANCLGADPELFFTERGESTEPAKAVCRGCVVRLDCLEYALDNGEKFGIWGGLSERERRGLRRTRRVARRQSEMAAAGRPNLRVVSDV